MLNKLKYLKAYWERNIVPGPDNIIGKILYTSKNQVGRRNQIVIDVDNNITDITTIDEYPADPKTYPGEEVLKSYSFIPQVDKELYIFNSKDIKPVLKYIAPVNYKQSITEGSNISSINLFSSVFFNDKQVTVKDPVTFKILDKNNLNYDDKTGNVTLVNNTKAGTYFLKFMAVHTFEPSVFVEGYIEIVINK